MGLFSSSVFSVAINPCTAEYLMGDRPQAALGGYSVRYPVEDAARRRRAVTDVTSPHRGAEPMAFGE
jgi:hypothetical protein